MSDNPHRQLNKTAYSLRDDDHWYNDSWAIVAVGLGIALYVTNREREKLAKSKDDD
jgi:hypothetical protein